MLKKEVSSFWTSQSSQWAIRSLFTFIDVSIISHMIAMNNLKIQHCKKLYNKCLLLHWSGCQEEEAAGGAGDAEASGRGGCSEHKHQAGADCVPRTQCHSRLRSQLAKHTCPHCSATPCLCAPYPCSAQPHPCLCTRTPHRAPGNTSCSPAWFHPGGPAAHHPPATDIYCHPIGAAPNAAAASGPGEVAQLPGAADLEAKPGAWQSAYSSAATAWSSSSSPALRCSATDIETSESFCHIRLSVLFIHIVIFF